MELVVRSVAPAWDGYGFVFELLSRSEPVPPYLVAIGLATSDTGHRFALRTVRRDDTDLGAIVTIDVLLPADHPDVRALVIDIDRFETDPELPLYQIQSGLETGSTVVAGPWTFRHGLEQRQIGLRDVIGRDE